MMLRVTGAKAFCPELTIFATPMNILLTNAQFELLRPSKHRQDLTLQTDSRIAFSSLVYSSYGADTKLHLKPSRGNNSESMKARVAILVCDTSS